MTREGKEDRDTLNSLSKAMQGATYEAEKSL